MEVSLQCASPGALFTHWIADSLTLWKSPVTDEHLWTAASYYSILAKGPSEILYFLSAVVILGGTTILWSLNDGEAGNLMFDGGSICKLILYLSNFPLPIYTPQVLFGTAIAMYLHSVLPSTFTVPAPSLSVLIRCRPIRKIQFAPSASAEGPLSARIEACYTRASLQQPHLQCRPYRCPRPPGWAVLGRERRRWRG